MSPSPDRGGRVLGVDFGARRIGLAISDRTGTLARPLETILVHGAADAVNRLASRIAAIAAEEDGPETIVVGRPAHLDGRASEATAGAIAFVAALQAADRCADRDRRRAAEQPRSGKSTRDRRARLAAAQSQTRCRRGGDLLAGLSRSKSSMKKLAVFLALILLAASARGRRIHPARALALSRVRRRRTVRGHPDRDRARARSARVWSRPASCATR